MAIETPERCHDEGLKGAKSSSLKILNRNGFSLRMRCGMTSRFLVVHPWLRFCCNQGLDCEGAEGTARK